MRFVPIFTSIEVWSAIVYSSRAVNWLRVKGSTSAHFKTNFKIRLLRMDHSIIQSINQSFFQKLLVYSIQKSSIVDVISVPKSAKRKLLNWRTFSKKNGDSYLLKKWLANSNYHPKSQKSGPNIFISGKQYRNWLMATINERETLTFHVKHSRCFQCQRTNQQIVWLVKGTCDIE
jgi:hypothetical protein